MDGLTDKKLDIFREWEQDPRYQGLSLEQRSIVAGNFFDKNVGGQEKWSTLDDDTKKKTRQNFIDAQLVVESDPITTPKPETPKKLGFMEKWEEVKENKSQLVPFVSGAVEVKDIANVALAAHRLEKNEGTAEDYELVKQFAERANKDTTFGYKVADVVSMMPAFMGEFVATGGIYSIGRKAATKTATELTKKYLGKTGTKFLEKRAGQIALKSGAGIVGGTLQAPVMGALRITSGTIEKMMPEFQLSENEKKEIELLIKPQSGEDLLPALAKSFGDQWVETVSEHSGGLFSELGTVAKNAAIKLGLFRAFLKRNPNLGIQKARELFKKVGYNGVINEMLEERAGEVGRGVLGVGEYKLPTAEQLAVELASFSVPGVVQAGAAKILDEKRPTKKPPKPTSEQIVALIDTGMTTGKTPQGQPFTPIVATELIKKAHSEGVIGVAELETLKEKYPTLKEGINSLSAETAVNRVRQITELKNQENEALQKKRETVLKIIEKNLNKNPNEKGALTIDQVRALNLRPDIIELGIESELSTLISNKRLAEEEARAQKLPEEIPEEEQEKARSLVKGFPEKARRQKLEAERKVAVEEEQRRIDELTFEGLGEKTEGKGKAGVEISPPKPTQKAREEKIKPVELPTITSTNEAIAFGKKATPEQTEEVKRQLGIAQKESDEAGKQFKENPTDENANRFSEAGFKLQMLRETLNWEKGEESLNRIRGTIKKAKEDKTIEKQNIFNPEKDRFNTWVKKKGGINYNQEAMKGELARIQESGSGKFLVNKTGKGKTLDDLTQQAIAEGFLEEGSTPREFLDLLETDLSAKVGTGKEVYSKARRYSDKELAREEKEHYDKREEYFNHTKGLENEGIERETIIRTDEGLKESIQSEAHGEIEDEGLAEAEDIRATADEIGDWLDEQAEADRILKEQEAERLLAEEEKPTEESFTLTAEKTPTPKKEEPKQPSLIETQMKVPTTGIRGTKPPVSTEELPLIAKPKEAEAKKAQKELPTGKQPWEMTQIQFYNDTENIKIEGRVEIVNDKPVYKYKTSINGDTYEIESKGPLAGNTSAERLHKKAVQQALAEGKPVPEEVLNDYPDLRGDQGRTLKGVGTSNKEETKEKEGKLLTSEESKAPLDKDKIEDFGEKIGGARKDTAERGYTTTKTPKEETAEPAWQKKFVVAESLAHPGQWTILSKGDKFSIRARGTDQLFPSEEEAKKAIPLFAVAQNHRVYEDREKKNEFAIYKKVGDRKLFKVVNQTFPSREEAMKHMAEHAEEILNIKTSFGEEILPVPEIAKRTGIERRTDNATPEMFMETFAPRGIEFGNWNNQEERQQVMNHAFDGLLDLAEVLNVPPKALMLNGDLAIAFGARGQGLSGAAAHYETDYGVINLTKMKGAGKLSHEWFHALDHYFGRLDTKAKSEKEKNARGDMVYPKQSDREQLLSHGASYKSQLREELKEKYKTLIEGMYKKAEQYIEDTKRADTFLSKAREELKKDLDSIRKNLERDLAKEYTWRKSKSGLSPATTEQLVEFDRLANILLEGGDLETSFRYNNPEGEKSATRPKGMNRSTFGRLMAGHQSNDTLEGISSIYKAVRNRSGFTSERTGPLDGLRALMTLYGQRLKMFEDAKAGTEKTKKVPTNYAIEAKKMDQARVGDYWSEPHEMAARAFASYVEDKITERGDQSDFLVYHAHGGILLPMIDGFVARPYPEGEERTAINNAFDDFISTLQTKETEKGVALFSRKNVENTEEDGKESSIDKLKEPVVEYDYGKQAPTQKTIEEETSGIPSTGRQIDKLEASTQSFAEVVSSPKGWYDSGLISVKSSDDAAHIGEINLANYPQEHLSVILTDKDEKVLSVYQHTIGIPESAQISPKVIAGQALNTKGSANIWLIHNHPGGSASLSQFDIQGFNEIENLLEGTSIKPQDMIAVTPGYYGSLKEKEKPIQKIEPSEGIILVERKFKNQAAGDVIKNHREAADFAKTFLPEGGVVLLTNGHIPTGTLTVSNYEKLRGESQELFLKEIEKRNASAFFIAEPKKDVTSKELANLHSFAKAAGIEFLDAIDKDGSIRNKQDEWVKAFGLSGAIFLKRNQQVSSGIRKPDLENSIIPILNNLKIKPKVTVVQSYDELPQDFRKKFESQGGGIPEGVIDPANGNIYLIADNLPSIQRAQSTLLHELYGHFGAIELFGSKFEPFLNKIYLSYGPKGLKEIADLYGLDLSTKEGRLEASAEKLAQMAETNEKPAILQQIYQFIRNWLRDMGFDLKLTDQDLKDIISKKIKPYLEGKNGLRETRQELLAEGLAPMASRKADKFNRQLTEQELLKKPDIPVTNLTERKFGGEAWSARINALRWVKENIQGKSYKNKDTQWNIEVTGQGIKKAKSGDRNYRLDHLETMRALPELLTEAVLVESHPDKAGSPDIRAIHRFHAPLLLGDNLYRIKLTVKETKQGRRFYDHSLTEIEKPAGTTGRSTASGIAYPDSTVRLSKINIADLLQNATKNDGTKFDFTENKNNENFPLFSRRDETPEEWAERVLEEARVETTPKTINDTIKLDSDFQKNYSDYQKAAKLENPESVDPRKELTPEELNNWVKSEWEVLAKTTARMKPKNLPHASILEQLLASPEFYQHPILKELVDYALERNNLFYDNMNYLNEADISFQSHENVTEATKALAMKGVSKKSFYLLGRTSNDYKLLQEIIDKGDIEAKDSQKYEEELRQGLPKFIEIALENQGISKQITQGYKENGIPEDVINTWKLHRKSYDKALEMLIAPLEKLQAEYEQAKRKSPDFIKITEGGQQVMLNLKEAIAEMKKWEGSYAPRMRDVGDWIITGYKTLGVEKERVLYRRNHAWQAEKLAQKLRSQGFTVSDPVKRPPISERTYEIVKVMETAKFIEQAAKRMDINDFDAKSKFLEGLFETTADMFRERGFRSHQIHRQRGSVVKGYIEDPNERFVRYISNVSAGFAKAETAKKMALSFFGVYDKLGIRTGGVDQNKEPNVYDVGSRYIEEQLRNSDAGDRFIALVKSIATFKYLGFNPRSMAVNATAMITTVPASLHEYAGEGKVGFNKISMEIGRALQQYARRMANKEVSFSKEEESFINEIEQRHYDNPQYARDASGTIRGAYGRTWSNAMAASMYVFGKEEQLMRGATMLAGFRIAKNAGFSFEEAEERAKLSSNRAHGIYGKATLPIYAQGNNIGEKFVKLFYTYMKFPHTYLQTLYDLGMRKKNIKAFVWQLAAPVVLGGTAAIPFKDLIMGFIASLMKLLDDDRDPEKMVWDGVRENLGPTVERAGRLGALGLAGVDLSGSLSIGVGIPRNAYELFGVAGGVTRDLAEGYHYMFETEQPGRALEKVLPTGIANIPRAIRESTTGATTSRGRRVFNDDGTPYVPSNLETALRALGFRSSREAVLGSQKWETTRESRNFKESRDNILEQYRSVQLNPSPGKEKAVNDRIAEYNDNLIETGKAGKIPFITKRSLEAQERNLGLYGKDSENVTTFKENLKQVKFAYENYEELKDKDRATAEKFDVKSKKIRKLKEYFTKAETRLEKKRKRKKEIAQSESYTTKQKQVYFKIIDKDMDEIVMLPNRRFEEAMGKK